jgi:hemerythrin-like domain-containing protein
MLPIDVLMDEHVLILQMINLVKAESEKAARTGKVDPNFIVSTVDFFRTYADRYHHGKEEGILFKALYGKKLSEADGEMMNELILEHVKARKTVTALEALKNDYVAGKTEAEKDIICMLNVLAELYPVHIKKEDTQFFLPSMKYFSAAEQQKMQDDFNEFDMDFTTKKYRKIVETLQLG